MTSYIAARSVVDGPTYSSTPLQHLLARPTLANKKIDFALAYEEIGKTSLREAQVLSIAVVRGNPHAYLMIRIKNPEEKDTGIPEFSIRLQLDHTQNSIDNDWPMKVELFGNMGTTARIIMEGTYDHDDSFRASHIFDLARTFGQIRAESDEGYKQKHDKFSDEDFALGFAAIVHQFSSVWKCTSSMRDLLLPLSQPKRLENYLQRVTTKFCARWCDSILVPDLQNLRSWRKGGALNRLANNVRQRGGDSIKAAPIRIVPKDGDRLFYLSEPTNAFRYRLGVTSGREITMALAEFCDYIRLAEATQQPDAFAVVTKVMRFQELAFPKHQYLLLHAQYDAKSSIWIRLDRSAMIREPKMVSKATFSANDTATIGLKEADLHQAKFRNISYQVKDEEKEPETQTLRDVVGILDIFREHSPEYRLLSENCWFHAFLLDELLALHNENVRKEPHRLQWVKFSANKTRVWMLDKVREHNADLSTKKFKGTEFESTPNTGPVDQIMNEGAELSATEPEQSSRDLKVITSSIDIHATQKSNEAEKVTLDIQNEELGKALFGMLGRKPSQSPNRTPTAQTGDLCKPCFEKLCQNCREQICGVRHSNNGTLDTFGKCGTEGLNTQTLTPLTGFGLRSPGTTVLKICGGPGSEGSKVSLSSIATTAEAESSQLQISSDAGFENAKRPQLELGTPVGPASNELKKPSQSEAIALGEPKLQLESASPKFPTSFGNEGSKTLGCDGPTHSSRDAGDISGKVDVLKTCSKENGSPRRRKISLFGHPIREWTVHLKRVGG